MKKIIHYSRVGQISLRTTGSSTTPYYADIQWSWYGVSETRGKFAVYADGEDDLYTIQCQVDNRIRNNRATPTLHKKLFVSSSCTIPRDLFRKSYSLVRNADSADCVVVPDKLNKCGTEDADIILTHTYATVDGFVTDLLLVQVSYNFNNMRALPQLKTSEAVLKEITRKLGPGNVEVLFCSDFFGDKVGENFYSSRQRVLFMPNVPEYEEIMLSSYPNRMYVYEHQVDYDAPVTISPSTLWIWYRHADDDFLLRSIVSSDWQKYPLTISVFLASKFGRFASAKKLGPANIIWDTLNVSEITSSNSSNLPGFVVEPHDMETLQDWIFKELGIDGNNGFPDKNKIMELPQAMSKFLQKRWAVSKIKLSQPTLLQNVKQNC